MILAVITLIGLGLGLLIAPHVATRGVLVFAIAAALLFVVQVIWHAVTGYEGLPLSDSLTFFNGSWTSYLGFNAQITWRAFALPLAVLSVATIWQMRRHAS